MDVWDRFWWALLLMVLAALLVGILLGRMMAAPWRAPPVRLPAA